MKGHTIITDWQSTPQCWSAFFDNYDGAPDAKPPRSLIGYGKTEVGAVADLLEQEEERLLRGAPGFGDGWYPCSTGDVEHGGSNSQ
jgi:hypothetical protein